MRSRRTNAFTLVEILIVVVILGILAAVVIAGFTGATSEAQASATASELSKMRRQIGVFQCRNNRFQLGGHVQHRIELPGVGVSGGVFTDGRTADGEHSGSEVRKRLRKAIQELQRHRGRSNQAPG